jgi:hypothetical protein
VFIRQAKPEVRNAMLMDVQGARMLVAPDGSPMGEHSPEFLVDVLGDPDPDYDAALFAVKNLGFVLLRESASLLEVTVHPRAVAWPAVDAAIGIMASSSAETFAIKHLQQEWRREIATSARAASAKFLELCRDAAPHEDHTLH